MERAPIKPERNGADCSGRVWPNYRLRRVEVSSRATKRVGLQWLLQKDSAYFKEIGWNFLCFKWKGTKNFTHICLWSYVISLTFTCSFIPHLQFLSFSCYSFLCFLISTHGEFIIPSLSMQSCLSLCSLPSSLSISSSRPDQFSYYEPQ